MKNKNFIWRWFRRRPLRVIGNTEQENKKVGSTPVINNVDNSKEEKNKFLPTPPDDKNKNINVIKANNARRVPKQNNFETEREILIKPKKATSLENTLTIKKEKKVVTEEKIEQNEHLINKDEKKESKEKTNDIIIKTNTLDEIEKMIRKNYYEIQNIKREIEIIENEEKDKSLKEDVEKLIDRLNKLIKQLEEIKKDFYKKNLEKIYQNSTEDTYISHLIEEYKASFIDNNINDNALLQIKQIEEYIYLINDIIDIEKNKDTLNKTLEDKKENFEIRDKDFEELQTKYDDVEKMNLHIESFSKEQSLLINEITAKVESSVNVTKEVEYKTQLYINYSKLLTSTLLMGMSSAIPFNRGGNLLKAGLMMAAVAGMASSIKTRTYESKTTTKINYTDYEKEILSGINNIDDMDLMIDKTILDIKFIKENFEKEFSQYKNEIPMYYELITKLDSIEKDLLVKQQIAKDYNKKLQDTLDKNNVKVKRLEEEISN